MTTDPIRTAQKRTIQYWYVDGSFEFFFGGICLVLATYFYTNHLLADSWLANLLTGLFVLVMLGGGYVVNRLVMMMKERITFPRTGYISFQRKTGSARWVRMLLVGLVAAIVSAAMTILLLNRPAGFDWIVATTGLVFGAVIAYLGLRTGLARFFVNAAVSLVSGIALGFVNLPENLGLTSFYGILGTLLLVIGGLALWQYLRQNPRPVEGGDAE
jgi:hypothetical protein